MLKTFSRHASVAAILLASAGTLAACGGAASGTAASSSPSANSGRSAATVTSRAGGSGTSGGSGSGTSGGSDSGSGSGTSASTTSTTAAPTSATTSAPTTAAPATTDHTATPSTTTPPATTAPSRSTSTTTAAAGTAAGSQEPVLLVRMSNGNVGYEGREPKTIDYSVDSSNIVDHIHWSSWGPQSAVGHGVWTEESCNPNCATGPVTNVPATITLGGVSAGHFTTMTEQAGKLDKAYRYPADWALGAN